MTEDEAKTKTCVHRSALHQAHLDFSNSVHGPSSSPHGYVFMTAGLKCIGSDCMAWRWCDDIAEMVSNKNPSLRAQLDGYCGLACKP